MTSRATGASFLSVSFNNFDLSSEVVRGVQAMGFAEPTPIQLRAFPIILAGKDVIGTAQTGTGKTSRDRQTLLFSATLPPEIERLAAWVLREPELVEIGVRRSPAETVTHAVYPVAAEQKFDLLMVLLERTNFDSALIFSRTKHGADRIAHKLKQGNHSVAVLHSNRTQRERIEALEGFKSGKYEVMVATDIAARGLDIAGVSHVINYDVPEHPEDYVHRIRRTGRAQNVGDAFTLM